MSVTAIRRSIIGLAVIVGWPLSVTFGAEIERVEPPNWWVGFQHPELELLVYGEDVGTLSPSVDWPGVSIDEVIATGNPNYLFLRLSIGPDTEAGEFDLVFTGDDDAIAHAYSLDERNQDPEHTLGFSSADAIYLITPDRFANGDPENDEIEGLGDILDRSLPRGRHGGDVRGHHRSARLHRGTRLYRSLAESRARERHAGVFVSWLFHHGFLPGGPAQGQQRRVG